MRKNPQGHKSEYAKVIQPADKGEDPIRQKVKRKEDIEKGQQGKQTIARSHQIFPASRRIKRLPCLLELVSEM